MEDDPQPSLGAAPTPPAERRRDISAMAGAADHSGEPHGGGVAGRLNWLRAAVLGADDGIVSVAGIVVGVAGATTSRGPIFTAGLAGLVLAVSRDDDDGVVIRH